MTVWLTSIALMLGGCGLLVFLCRRIDRESALTKIILWSYGVRVVLTLILFSISFWRLPILRSLQVGGGFWIFGLDCIVYHHYGARIVEAWNLGIELPNPGLGIEYFAVVALIYKLLGSAHPLYPALVNSLMAASNGLLAYLIVRRLADRRAALISAGLVSFWPSTLIWSTQLLKDSLSWMLIFLVLWLVVRAVLRAHDGNRSAVRWVGLYLSLAITVILVTRLRYYVGSALSLAALIVFVPVAVTALKLKEKRVARCAGSLGIALVVVLSTLFARTLDTRELLTPARPEAGHSRLGFEYWRQGDFKRAAEEFCRSLALNRTYQPAQRGLEVINVQTPAPSETAVSLEAPANVSGPPQLPEAADARRTTASTALAKTQENGAKIGKHLKVLLEGMSELDDHAIKAAQESTPEELDLQRQGFISSGGHALMDRWADIPDLRRLMTYLPRALMVGILAPFPWQWFDTKGSTGVLRSFSGIEMIVIYFLLPGILVSIWNTVKQRDAAGLFMLTFTVLLACVLSLVVANLGTLFRLRLQFLLPLVMFAPIGHPMTAYRRLYSACRNLILKQRYRRVDQPERVQPRAEAL